MMNGPMDQWTNGPMDQWTKCEWTTLGVGAGQRQGRVTVTVMRRVYDIIAAFNLVYHK